MAETDLVENEIPQIRIDDVINDPRWRDQLPLLNVPWQDYRDTLERLEEISLQRWADLTRQARWSFSISMGMSLGLFLVGTTIVIWVFPSRK